MTDYKVHKREEMADEPVTIRLGFIGHVGHGKSSVSAALEKVSTGKVSEPDPSDSVRGITLVSRPLRTHIGKNIVR